MVAIDVAKRAVTLDHGPIPGLMPAMRMEFPVEKAELCEGLQVSDVVRFSLQPRGPEWVVVTVEKVGEAQPPPVKFPAPDFALPTLSGAAVRLADLRGKVVLVNFWATWCVPCRTEIPSIETLYQRHKNEGLEVVAVNLDTLSTASVEAFLKEVPVTFPVVLDPSWSTARGYMVVGLPTSYLIDPRGDLVVREVGERDWMDGISRAAVEGLLREAGSPPQKDEKREP